MAAALMAVERGARIVRVHDVRETVQALRVLAQVQMQALEQAQAQGRMQPATQAAEAAAGSARPGR